MVTETEFTLIEGEIASCNGGGSLGHPLVYLNLGSHGSTICPYCGHHFVNNNDKRVSQPSKKTKRRARVST